MTEEGLLLSRVLLEGFLSAVVAGAVVVLLFNKVLTRLRESPLKKLAPLALVPLAIAAGAGHGWALWHGFTTLPLVVPLGMIVLGLALLWFVRESREDRLFQRHRLRTGYPTLLPREAGGVIPAPLQKLLPVNHSGTVQWSRLDLPARAGKQSEAGSRILFLADFHLHPALNTAFIRAAIRQALDSRPDVVLLGGDFVTKRPQCEEAAALLKEFDWPAQTFAVRGNHDFWTRPDFFRRALMEAEITLLSNEALRVRTDSGTELIVVGIEDPYIPLTAREEERLRGRIKELDGDGRLSRICIVHTPEAYELAARLDCDVVFGGHTHGGQVRLPLFGTTISSCPVQRRFAYGTTTLGRTRTVTTNGLGAYYGVRWRCPPEINEVRIGLTGQSAYSAR